MKKNIIISFLVVVILVLGACSFFYFKKAQNRLDDYSLIEVEETSNVNNVNIEYKNSEYGFTFTLPLEWKEYSVVNDQWEGSLLEKESELSQSLNGPKIIIRHPLWTAENPRQDIPVMIFTLAQWDLIQQEKLSLGAAPIGPSELGRNIGYVFALPARYNFAFLTGFEEVEDILNSKPLRAF